MGNSKKCVGSTYRNIPYSEIIRDLDMCLRLVFEQIDDIQIKILKNEIKYEDKTSYYALRKLLEKK